jgi:hypothetical protein
MSGLEQRERELIDLQIRDEDDRPLWLIHFEQETRRWLTPRAQERTHILVLLARDSRRPNVRDHLGAGEPLGKLLFHAI